MVQHLAYKSCLTKNGCVMRNLIQKIAIAWIAILGIIGLARDKAGKNEEKGEVHQQQQEVVLDEYELSSFHNI
jgi:hypothetical protein